MIATANVHGGSGDAACPIVKWVGGKTRLLPELLRRVPPHARYFEPFMGGAALFFALRPAQAVLNDANAGLVNLYQQVAFNTEALIRQLEDHAYYHCATHYYAVRANYNASEYTPVQRAGAFLYLNKTCFNGLWRENRHGEFNVPMGRYKNPPICNADALRAAAPLLARADLRCGDYRAAVADAGPGDFVYFDPPYAPVSETADFTNYVAGGFGAQQQRELAETARELVERGCRVMLSNSDTPLIRELYSWARIDVVKCARAINSNASKRGAVDEVIVTGADSAREGV